MNQIELTKNLYDKRKNMHLIFVPLLMIHIVYLSYAMEDQVFEYIDQQGNVQHELDAPESTKLLTDEPNQDYNDFPMQNNNSLKPYFLDFFNQLPEEVKEQICDNVNLGTLYALAPYFVWPGSIAKKIQHVHYWYLASQAKKIKEDPMRVIEIESCGNKDRFLNKQAYNEYSSLINQALNFMNRIVNPFVKTRN